MVIGISLGWNCRSAVKGVEVGIRKRKHEGYRTCPFDEMNSNYLGIVQAIQDDFKGFTDPSYLELRTISEKEKFHAGDTLIYNSKYNFIFNHESPGHAKLYQTQNWPTGINHFIENEYKHFRERYDRRIEQFRQYLHSGEEVIFILSTPRRIYTELTDALEEAYPSLKYSIYNIFYDGNENIDAFVQIHKQMGFTDASIEEEFRHL